MKVRPHSRRERSISHWCLAVLSASIGSMAFAQQTQIIPSVSLTETITDNVSLKRSSEAESEMITQVIPNIVATTKGGRVEGSMQAALSSAFYANDGGRNRNYLTLNGMAKVEAWEKRGFIDLSATVSREALSALGPKSGDTVTGTANQGEVRNVVISPYLTGRFGATGKANLRYTHSETDSSSSTLQKMQRDAISVNLADPRAFGASGWTLAFTDSLDQTANRRDLKTQNARLTGLLQVDPQLVLRLVVGSESNNYRSDDVTRSTIMGVGADLSVSPLTKFSGLWEDRFFGPGYSFTAEHRRGFLLFTGSYSKDVSTTSQSLTGTTFFNTYDFLMAALQGQYPNETERAIQVRTYMADRQLPERFGASQAVLSNGMFLDRRIRFGVSLTGDRNSLLFSGFRSQRNNLTDQSFTLGGDFQQADRVNETGGSVTLSHRLTPLTSANVGLTMTRSHRDSTSAAASQANRSRIFTAALITRFTPKTSGTLNFRNNRGEGLTAYTENALIGSLSIRF